MRKLLLTSCALLVMGGCAFADGVITLELETPTLQNEASTSNVTRQQKVTTVTGKAGQGQQIARVGLVSAEKAAIYASPSTKSRIYSKCLKDVPLAIIGTSGSWYGVLMIDGSTGWIPTDRVKLLDYGVVASNARNDQQSLPSRGGTSRSDFGNPLIQTALRYTGVPYVYGGTSTTNGIDCSAFVRMVFSQHGYKLPRTAREQANVGTPVSFDELQAGDRLYFQVKHSYPDHCGIYMGNGYFIHASASRGGVAVDKLAKVFYSNNLVAAMR